MSSYAPKAIYAMYGIVRPHIASMEESGIVGNSAHTYGYHCARNDLIRDGNTGDYSISEYAQDRLGDGGAACAIDMKFSPHDMIVVSKRLISLCQAHDTRLRGMREFFGTTDGYNTTGYSPQSNRYESTGDTSHLWHVHISILREFSNDFGVCANIASAIAGIPVGHPARTVTIKGRVYAAIDALHVVQAIQAQNAGYVSRNTFTIQEWLTTAGYAVPLDGQWGVVTQNAYNAFRGANGFTGSDAIGTVGFTSLTLLHDKANGSIPVIA